MKRISLNDSLNQAYRVVNECVLGIKTSVINLCTEIDRYFALRFNVDISKRIDEIEFQKIVEVFPLIANMTLEQFNRYLIAVINIRRINAHLHLCLPIYLDEDIETYLSNILHPLYKVTNNRMLTVYGQAYILSFLSQKINIWQFVTSFYKKNHFEEINTLSSVERSSFQVKQQHLTQNYCGIGKPIFPSVASSIEWQYMNDVFKSHLTRLVFSLEKECLKTSKSFTHAWSLAKELNNTHTFSNNKKVLDRIVFLRNSWFHGHCLNDMIEKNGKNVELTYKKVLESFIEIKAAILNGKDDQFDLVKRVLNSFALSCLCFYLLRMIEISYKLIDNRLLTKDKVESRIENMENAYKRFLSADNAYYELCGELIEPDDLLFRVGSSKFTDFLTRVTKCKKIKVLTIHSEEGIMIGDFQSEKREVTLVLIDLDEQYQNKVNGKYLNEYLLCDEKKFGSKISTYQSDAQ